VCFCRLKFLFSLGKSVDGIVEVVGSIPSGSTSFQKGSIRRVGPFFVALSQRCRRTGLALPRFAA
jgi:hypothetical protein